MNNKPAIGTIVTFTSAFGSETGKVVGYATLDPDTLQIESNGDIFAKHYGDVTVAIETPDLTPRQQEIVKAVSTRQRTSDTYVEMERLRVAGFGASEVAALACDGGPLEEYYSFSNNPAYHVRPTIAPVAITDDSAVDNTPSEPKANDGQPSGSDNALALFLAFDEREFGYNSDIVIPSGWVADALATVNVTTEAIKADEYLPPTGDDNDDLPFSDLGEDETFQAMLKAIPEGATPLDEYDSLRSACQATIASLEARVKELETENKAFRQFEGELWDMIQQADSSQPIVDEIETAIKAFQRARIYGMVQ